MPVRNLPHFVHPHIAGFHPSGRPKSAVILRPEFVARAHIVMKQPAIVDDAGNYLDVVFARSRKAETAWPRFQRIEDDHGPIDDRTEAFEAMQNVQSETISGAGGNAEPVG